VSSGGVVWQELHGNPVCREKLGTECALGTYTVPAKTRTNNVATARLTLKSGLRFFLLITSSSFFSEAPLSFRSPTRVLPQFTVVIIDWSTFILRLIRTEAFRTLQHGERFYGSVKYITIPCDATSAALSARAGHQPPGKDGQETKETEWAGTEN
jgi:hypothetical protein